MDRERALLVAVAAEVDQLRQPHESKWQPVARAMERLTGEVERPDVWRKRWERARIGTNLEELEAVASEVQEAVRAAAEGAGAIEQPDAAGDAETQAVLDPHTLPDTYWDELYRNAAEQARLRQQQQKPTAVFTVRVPEQAPIMLVWTADWHLLDAGTDHDRFDADMATWQSTPGLYVLLGGDYANWFSPAVLPRAMPANTLPSDLTEPIVRRKIAALHGLERRILAGVAGNHDEFPAAAGWHPVDRILGDLAIPNLGPGGRVYLEVGDERYQIEARHSWNYNSSLNDTNSHRRLWEQAGCPDMVFTAHLHHPTMHHRTFDGRDTVWARNGAYKQEDHYARSKNFIHTQHEPPDQPGVILYPDTHHMIPFRDYRDGLALLASLRAPYQQRQTA